MAFGIWCTHCGGYEAAHFDDERYDIDTVYEGYKYSLRTCSGYNPERELTDDEKQELKERPIEYF